MALILSESFGAGIPGGFATILNDTGSLTATHNAGQSAVDLVKDGFNAIWRIDACPTALNVRVLLDLEVVALNNAGSGSSGFGVSLKAASQSYYHHIPCSTEDSNVLLRAGSAGGPYSWAASFGGAPAYTFPTTGRYVYEFTCARDAGGTHRWFIVKKDGEQVYVGAGSMVPYADQLQVAVFMRDSSYRLHSIEVYDDASVPALGGLSPPVYGLRSATTSPTGSSKSLVSRPSISADASFGGRYKITGTVKVDSNPDYAVARLVRLFEQRSGVLMASTWSNATTGEYTFNWLSGQYKYFVVAFDYEQNYRAVIADNVTPEPM